MKRRVLLLLFLCGFCSSSLYAQKKRFLNSMDSTATVNPYIVDEPDFEAFLAGGIPDQLLDPLQVDTALLNATVFHTINKFRKKKRRLPLEYAPSMEIVASTYTTKFRRFRFGKDEKNDGRINKLVNPATRRVRPSTALTQAVVRKPEVVRRDRRKPWFHDHKDQETELQLFYGKKTDLKDSSFVKVPIEYHTYRSFAESFLIELQRGRGGREVTSKAYSLLAIYLVVDDRTLQTSKVPVARATVMFGAYRVPPDSRSGLDDPRTD